MADQRDPDISRKYRELGAEEPPRALDDAILAASRRAMPGKMRARPAPLVAPTGRSRWYFPVAAAAVITLAVAVTVQVERQKPDDELVVASAPPQAQKEERAAPQVEKKEQAFGAPAAEQPKPAQKPARSPQPFTPEPPPAAPVPPSQATAPQTSADSLRELAKSTDPDAAGRGNRSRERATTGTRGGTIEDQRLLEAPAAVQGAPAPEPAQARRDTDARVRAQIQPKTERAEAQARPAPGSMAGVASAMLFVSPELWLEQIAELRRHGKHEEADKALAEFRKRYPEYRISEEMLRKVDRP
jgi:hypothetical protein